MLRKIFTTLSLSVAAITLNASTTVTLQGVNFNVDTLKHIKVGPGTMYTSYLFTSQSTSKVFRAYSLSMEMTGHDNVEYRMEIGNDTTLTTERISSIAQRKSDSDTHYFAAVNADFYITASYVPEYTGQPHMDCIMDGVIAGTGYLAAADYGHFFMDKDKYMWCDNPTQSFTVTFPGGTTVEMPRINQDIYENELVLFNSKYGRQTRVAGCTEVQVALAEGETWGVNRPIKLVVTSAPSTSGSTPITADGAVLSATGTATANIESLNIGDELTVNFSISLQDYNVSPDIKECSGGDVVILKRGEVIMDAIRFINGRDSNNPRTMLGYNEDRSIMVWGLVDGRRTGVSDGCTYPEGAELMKFFGCYDALNVDGGGSSGMYIEPFGIVNSPSDGSERAVSNGIFAVLNAPEDNEIAEIRFVDWAMRFPKYGTYQPVIYGYNRYGLLINTDVQGFSLSCPAELGEITNDGTTFFGNGDGSHLLTATYNGLTATLPVTVVGDAATELKYTDVLLDNYREWPVDVQAKVNESYMAVSPEALSWISADETVATVDANGLVKGLKDGTTSITGTIGDYTGIVNLTVECPTDRVMTINNVADSADWTISKSGIKNLYVKNLDKGLAIDYMISSARGPIIKLNGEKRVWSLPDALQLRLTPIGDAAITRVTVGLISNKGELVAAKFEDITSGEENTLTLNIADYLDVNDIGIYPITLRYIYVEPKGATSTAFRVEIPGIEAIYNNAPSGVESIGVDSCENNTLNISVNDGIISIGETAETIELYNLAGQKVAEAHNSSTIDAPVAGLYIIRAVIDSIPLSAKIVL